MKTIIRADDFGKSYSSVFHLQPAYAKFDDMFPALIPSAGNASPPFPQLRSTGRVEVESKDRI
jgi:hypothetical protein